MTMVTRKQIVEAFAKKEFWTLLEPTFFLSGFYGEGIELDNSSCSCCNGANCENCHKVYVDSEWTCDINVNTGVELLENLGYSHSRAVNAIYEGVGFKTPTCTELQQYVPEFYKELNTIDEELLKKAQLLSYCVTTLNGLTQALYEVHISETTSFADDWLIKQHIHNQKQLWKLNDIKFPMLGKGCAAEYMKKQQERIKTLEAKLQKTKAEVEELTTINEKLSKEINFERSVSNSLMKRIKLLENTTEEDEEDDDIF